MKNLSIKASWIFTIIYLIIGLACLIWGGIKNIKSSFGIVLIILLAFPLICSILRSLKVKLPNYFRKILTAEIYCIFLISAGLSYKLQDVSGYLLIMALFVFYALLTLVFAFIDTLKNRQDGVYYYVKAEKRTACSLKTAFKKYYADEFSDGLFDAIFNLFIF